MKTIQLTVMLILIAFICPNNASAQQLHEIEKAEVTLIVKGMKEAKGSILFAVGNQADPKSMQTGMETVRSTDSVVCVLKDISIGETGVYVFQDMNNNFTLDMENNVPVEPCQNKNNVVLIAGKNTIEINLVDVREIMKKQ